MINPVLQWILGALTQPGIRTLDGIIKAMSKNRSSDAFAYPPATLNLGGREVLRLGFGAMRLPGRDVWGPPDDPVSARMVVRRAVALGVQFIDTSWYYGPHISNTIIAEAIHPYPADVIIATKLGGKIGRAHV